MMKLTLLAATSALMIAASACANAGTKAAHAWRHPPRSRTPREAGA